MNMNMSDAPGRSYKYLQNASGFSLFPFGFGLSYTTFSLKWSSETSMATAPSRAGAAIVVSGVVRSRDDAAARVADAATATTVSVTVTNTGKVAGDEVAFIFTCIILLQTDFNCNSRTCTLRGRVPLPQRHRRRRDLGK